MNYFYLTNRPPSIKSPSQPNGFTLLEVILAITILAIALSAMSKITLLAARNAHEAADSTEATLVARSVMAELQAGIRELAPSGPIEITGENAFAGWAITVVIEPTVVEELLQVRVQVVRSFGSDNRPSSELVRWFPAPNYAVAPAESAGTSSTAGGS